MYRLPPSLSRFPVTVIFCGLNNYCKWLDLGYLWAPDFIVMFIKKESKWFGINDIFMCLNHHPIIFRAYCGVLNILDQPVPDRPRHPRVPVTSQSLSLMAGMASQSSDGLRMMGEQKWDGPLEESHLISTKHIKYVIKSSFKNECLYIIYIYIMKYIYISWNEVTLSKLGKAQSMRDKNQTIVNPSVEGNSSCFRCAWQSLANIALLRGPPRRTWNNQKSLDT
jgi:hypothetical protein